MDEGKNVLKIFLSWDCFCRFNFGWKQALYNLQFYNCKMTDNLKNDISKYLFSLKRLRSECKIAPTIVDFSPPFISSESTKSIVPTFNHDSCHYTPSFTLNIDQKTTQRQKQAERRQFDDRINQFFSSSISKVQHEAFPSSRYCQICQQHFQNYDEHLQRKDHQLRCHHNQFNQDISKLCQLLGEKMATNAPYPKKKIIKKTNKNEHSEYLKFSPKTTVDNSSSKRKMSLTCESFYLQQNKAE